MKRLSTHIRATALFLLIFISFEISGHTLVRNQLEELNALWKSSPCKDPILSESRVLDEVTLIQLHLSLVENELRKTNPAGLTLQQRRNRAKCLDILHAYALTGIFPKNIHLQKRSPVFIDDAGTYCAVGQLIKETGYQAFAQEVSEENNYGYILDMNYTELDKWARVQGFLKEELAWIQPCYTCSNPNVPSSAGVTNVSCNGGSNGSWSPTPNNSWPGPYSYYFSRNGGPTNCTGSCLSAGTYTCIIQDGSGAQHPFVQSITEPSLLQESMTPTQASCGTCADGQASSSPSGGTVTYTYTWTPTPGGGQGTPTATNLIPGSYTCCVNDANNCQTCQSVIVTYSTGIEPLKENNLFTISPNPFEQFVRVTSALPFTDAELIIYDVVGREMIHQKLSAANAIISTADFPSGVYVFVLRSNEGINIRKLMRR